MRMLREGQRSGSGLLPKVEAVAAAAARRAVHHVLADLEDGRIEVTEGGRTHAFGPAGVDLKARVEVRDPRAYAWVLRGSTGLGEGYAEGLWEVDDLVALIRIVARNLAPLDRLRRRLHPLVGPIQRAATRVPRNTRIGARRNISAHYDLGNRLFESFLDRRLVYSCAYFPHAEAGIDEAQLAKLERICRQLDLRPDLHLLEIGAGWGALAIHAAAEHGCRVTTTTISREQHAYALERVREAGLEDRVTVRLDDYRDLDGRYDRLASIEMIEAVGWQYFDAFFSKCSDLLERDGLMFLQAIVIDDRLYEPEKALRSFSNTHIFPGGCLPSQRAIADLVADRTDMRTVWLEEISAHYARTLRLWRERFEDAWPSLRGQRGQGYDERFRRMWRFYLASSEGGFRERRIRDLQLALAKPDWRGDELPAEDHPDVGDVRREAATFA
jgi:cyclopropane-fatty-acyl-phospholipid synthase